MGGAKKGEMVEVRLSPEEGEPRKGPVLLVVGTRPEVVKLAPVYVELRKRSVEATWWSTGQQVELVTQTFGAFGMRPEIDLGMDRVDGSLTELMRLLAMQGDILLKQVKPAMVLVQGDTLSAAVMCQQAFLAKILTGHVEAGLRSWDVASPYPEEAARVWIDAVADVKFAPTRQAAGTVSGEVYVTGNTEIDATYMIRKKVERRGKYAVVTMHRRENIGAIEDVCAAIKGLVQDKTFDYVVWPLHPNPDVCEVVMNRLHRVPGVELIGALPYDRMLNTIRDAQMVLTDSGGLQEMCLSLGVPCLVMRKETERPEGVYSGGAKLVGTDTSKIYAWATWLMENKDERQAMINAANPYGDGKAAMRIAKVVKAKLEGRSVDPNDVEWVGVT